MASMWSCIRRKFGTIRKTIVPSTTTATGMKITSTIDRSTSSRRAITTPITMVMGAATAIVQAITTSICTCCTSLVMRVISDGAPNCPTSRAEKSVTRWNSASRRSRPKLIATLPPKYTAATAKVIWITENASISAPVVRMYAVSPGSTPLSMMSALSAGRVSEADTAMTCSPTMSRSRRR